MKRRAFLAGLVAMAAAIAAPRRAHATRPRLRPGDVVRYRTHNYLVIDVEPDAVRLVRLSSGAIVRLSEHAELVLLCPRVRAGLTRPAGEAFEGVGDPSGRPRPTSTEGWTPLDGAAPRDGEGAVQPSNLETQGPLTLARTRARILKKHLDRLDVGRIAGGGTR